MTATTFDPNLKSASGLALSNGNLTATATAGASVGATRACSQNTYFEITLGSTIATAQFVGMVNRGFPFSTTNLGADAVSGSIGWDSATGTVKINNATISTIQTGAANNVIGVAYNPILQLIWFRTGSGNWNNSGTANPATNTGGISTSSLGGPLYPAWGAAATGNNATATFTSGFANTPPSGYVSVDGIGVSGVNSAVARRASTFTTYGAAHGSVNASPQRVTSAMAQRNRNISGAWYGGIRVWSPAAAPTAVAGTVEENGVGVAGKTVWAFDDATGLLLGSAVSGVGGAYSIPALGRKAAVVVALDQPSFQGMAFDRVTPQ